MPNYNFVIQMGHMTRDPELEKLPSGTSVANFTVANNRKWKSKEGEDKESVAFVGCKAFGRTAEVIAQYFRKGDPVLVTGKLAQDNWTDGDGKKRSKTYVIVDSFEFVGKASGGKQDDGPQDQGGGDGGDTGGQGRQPAPQDNAPGARNVEDDGDIPF